MTIHVNATHDVPAADFKRSTGFNVGSGLVGNELAKGLANEPNKAWRLILTCKPWPKSTGARRDWIASHVRVS